MAPTEPWSQHGKRCLEQTTCQLHQSLPSRPGAVLKVKDGHAMYRLMFLCSAFLWKPRDLKDFKVSSLNFYSPKLLHSTQCSNNSTDSCLESEKKSKSAVICFMGQSISQTYASVHIWPQNKPHIRGKQFIIILTSEQICQFLQFCWLHQQMSINETTPVTLKRFRFCTPSTSTGQITPCVKLIQLH